MSEDPTFREPDDRPRRALLAEREALQGELSALEGRRHHAFWAGVILGISPLGAVALGGAAVSGVFGPRFGGPNPERAHICPGLDTPVDLDSDPQNCAGCGRVCPDDHPVCEAGACVCGPGHWDCADDGVCVALDTPQHCGDCGTVCEDGPCVAGRCDCGALTACEERWTRTRIHCVDLETDEANCGRCHDQCPREATCVGGTCVCAPGLTRCEHQDPGCVDTLHDPENCGGCGLVCPEGARCLPDGTCTRTRDAR